MGNQQSNPDKLSASKLYFEIFNTIRIRERRVYRSFITPIFELEFKQFQEAPLEIIIQTPDAVVIQGIQNFDERIYSNLHKRCFPRVKGILRKKGATPDVAEDIFQETIIDIIEQVKRGKFNITTSVENYIITIAVRKWSKVLKKRIEDRKLFADNMEDSNEIKSIIDPIEPTDNFDEVSEWLDELSEICKTLINEFYFNKKNWDKIASEHGYKNARSASTQKYKCLEPLRVRLDAKKYGM
jgi:RNA polymerase sigma factor (sigma-70 family)